MYRLKLKDIRFYDKMLGKILRIGLPTGIQNIVISFSNVIVQSSVNSFWFCGDGWFAAYVKIDGFNIMPVMVSAWLRRHLPDRISEPDVTTG